MRTRLTYPLTDPLSGPVAGARWRVLPHVTPCLGRGTPLAGSPPTWLCGHSMTITQAPHFHVVAVPCRCHPHLPLLPSAEPPLASSLAPPPRLQASCSVLLSPTPMPCPRPPLWFLLRNSFTEI